MMKIVIASDHYGYRLKEDIISYLDQLGHELVDLGCESAEVPVDYPDVAEELAITIANGEYDRGILICGTGIGMAMVANKVPGVRAACCHDPYSAERARKSNNAQIITMGAQIVAPTLARVLVDHWLDSEFGGGRSAPKVAKIVELDEKYRKT
ncbi:MAG: ribose 5-phosphate isomerase B [Anaerolineales bacterium]|nr:ribose 5-phosphate isomerase B [Anaerolineales bacterium]